MTIEASPPNLHDTLIDSASLRDTFREDVLDGLAREHKTIPPKHLYDARGSELFDEITGLDDYYPTRTERAIMAESIAQIAASLGPDVTLIEPGAGSGEKASRLLERMDRPRAFVPIEISLDALNAASGRLAERFPEIEVHPVCADFASRIEMPDVAGAVRRVVYFPGSTIGNLDRSDRSSLLAKFRGQAGDGGKLLIGTDLKKDEGVLCRAYNDRDGVTARFNENLLTRINRELNGTFDTDRFEHDAPWVEDRSRIEMHLVSQEDQAVEVGGQAFEFRAGERIHTESSHKFTPETFDEEAAAAGFTLEEAWQDARGWFRVGLYAAS